MRRSLLAVAFAILCHFTVLSQHGSISGSVRDTANAQNLSKAVVSLLRSKDSILQKFTRTGPEGQFQLRQVPPGKYILLISYPKYADYVEPISMDSGSSLQLNQIALIQKAKLLEEVIVRQKISAIKIKGDTTEFTADSFKVQANANVEELLKKLPGIQVDKDGKITAQGEKVGKVLVDGEEFFGDDPTLVTQNLRADMVDKVQVFDKKSDQAAFTGVDDGQTTKTINLKLKDSKKNGYFGKINAGGGTDGYFDNQAMINLFKKKKKLSVYGILSNTGKTGLNWEDRDKYGESIANNLEMEEGTGFYMINGQFDELDSWDGQYGGKGYPVVKTAGVHYNDKWNEDKQSTNLNYKLLQLNVEGSSGTNTQTILPDTVYYNSQRETFNNQILRHRGNGNYEWQLDSTTSIKVSANAGSDHKTTYSSFISDARNSDSALVNTGNRNLSSTGDTRTFGGNLLFKKKFAKKGRTLSVNLNEQYEKGNSEGYLYANNQFYKGNVPFSTQVTDQFKNYLNEKSTFDSKLTYSEPLSKASSLLISYGITVNNSRSNRNSFNKSSSGKYTDIDSLYSNDYRFNVFTHKAGLSYLYVQKKIRVNLGNNMGFTSFKQQDLHSDTTLKRDFINWFPQASFAYSFTPQKRLILRYNGNTSQPSIQQIQPIRNNEDPLNVNIGNPSLKPQFSNSVNLNYFNYRVLSETDIYGNINYNFIQNALSSRSFVDSNGKRTYQTINVDGNHSLNGWFGYGFKWKKAKLNMRFNANLNLSRNQSIVNNLLNTTNSSNYSLGTAMYKAKEKKYEFGYQVSATYTVSRSSVQTNLKTNYWSWNINPYFDIFLPKKFQVHSDADVNLRQKTSAFDFNTNVVLLNAWVGKKFLKGDVLLVKVSGNDLLNQNLGFNRSVSSNFVSQNTYTTIQRYFMLSVVWNFTKTGSGSTASK
ncbi:MAG: TonB-dependent receptor family protein [Bacteroidota bacterium]|nr:TonB-dependent receptor family protein [Bacteroidota bacterium]